MQVVADIPADSGAVVDVGSRIQAEKTRKEATQIIIKRNEELREIIDTVNNEYDELEKHVVELANLFNEAVGGIQLLDEETESPVEQIASTTPRRRSRRKRGTELTLDD